MTTELLPWQHTPVRCRVCDGKLPGIYNSRIANEEPSLCLYCEVEQRMGIEWPYLCRGDSRDG